MIKRFIPFLILGSLFTLMCDSPRNVKHITLKNGLRVYLIYRESPITSAVYQVQCGTSKGPAQLASLTNRMLLQGNQIRTGYQVFREIETMGGRLGADETLTTSYVYVTSPKSVFNDCFEIFSECITKPTFDNQQAAVTEFKKIKNKVVHLLLPSKSSHQDDDVLRTMLYENSALGVHKISAEGIYSDHEMMDFYQEYYRPENAILVICGQVDVQEIIQKIQNDWKTHEKHKPNQLPVELGRVSADSIRIQSNNNKLDRIVLGFRAPLPFDENFYETCLLRRALASGENSLLYSWMNQNSKFEYQPKAHYQYEYGFGYFSVSVEVPKSKTEYFRNKLWHEIKRIRETGISFKSVEIAKRKMVSDMAHVDQYTLKSAYLFSMALLQNHDDTRYFPHFDSIRQVTQEDVNQAARKLLQNPVILIHTNQTF